MTMKKFINAPDSFVDEALEGIVMAHEDKVMLYPADSRVVMRARRDLQGNKVGIVTGGGFGHLPVFLGYVGKGLADSCAVGNVFSSPSSMQIFHAMQAADSGKGVLQLFGCYQGDKMNFQMARMMAEREGIPCETVIVSDDIAAAPLEQRQMRRGIAGIMFAYKIAGACAETGADLKTVAAAAKKAADATRTFGVSLSSCTIPAVGRPNFSINEGKMEIGMGIHGEPGLEESDILTADETAELLFRRILEDNPCPKGSSIAVLVNGLGATPLEELYILYRRVAQLCAEYGIRVHRAYVGEFATSLEMAGASISVMKLDEELISLLDAPCDSPFFLQTQAERRERMFTVENLKEFLKQASLGIADAKDMLTQLDAQAGDGDLGVNMEQGFKAVAEAVETEQPESLQETFFVSAVAINSAAPSTLGTILSVAMQSFSNDCTGLTDIDQARFAEMLHHASDQMTGMGGAKRGDKTILDSLCPYAEYLTEHEGPGIWRDAAEKAEEAAQATAQLVPRIGRARMYGERGKGVCDGGAVLFAVIVGLLADYLENRDVKSNV